MRRPCFKKKKSIFLWDLHLPSFYLFWKYWELCRFVLSCSICRQNLCGSLRLRRDALWFWEMRGAASILTPSSVNPLKSDTLDRWRIYKALGFSHVGNTLSLNVRKGSPPMFAAFHSVIYKGEYGFSFCSKTPTASVAVVTHHLLTRLPVFPLSEGLCTQHLLLAHCITPRTKFLKEIILLYLKCGQVNFK